jgi:hypothetical protein
MFICVHPVYLWLNFLIFDSYNDSIRRDVLLRAGHCARQSSKNNTGRIRGDHQFQQKETGEHKKKEGLPPPSFWISKS